MMKDETFVLEQQDLIRQINLIYLKKIDIFLLT